VVFDPGLDSMRGAGIPVSRAPYQSGQAGIRQSLEAMAAKVREGKIDAGVKSWALDCLKAKGLDGRDRSTTPAKQAAAILECLRSATVYTADPYGTESIQAAGATLCLRPNLCVKGGDCDDLTVALVSMYLSIGLPAQIVKQNFGGDAQEHVLAAVFTGDDWQYADPSTNMPFGAAAHAVSEVWVDPMEPIGNLGEAQAEIVTLGKPGKARPRARSTTPHWPGLGSVLGYPTISDLLSLVDVAAYNLQQLQAVDCPGWPNDPAGYADWQKDLQQLKVDFDATAKYVNAYIGDQPKWAYDWSVVLYPWDQVRALIDREIDLDRRLRRNGSCTAPAYPETPQPKGLDPDLWAYQTSGSILKGVQTVAGNARQPVTIAIGGAIIGGVAAIGGLLLLDRLLRPIRR
jgi:Transglutaminase-like superfamily